jgi:hypothetical protein
MFTRESLQNTTFLSLTSALALGFIAWSSTQIYVTFCAPSGVVGFFQSLVTMDSSPCQAIFALIGHSQVLYAATIASLLVGCISFISSCCARKYESKCPPCSVGSGSSVRS